MFEWLPVATSLIYCILIFFVVKQRRQLYKEKEELRLVRDEILHDAAQEAEFIIKQTKKKYGPHIPSAGPTPAELEQNEALRIAWEEFNVIYRLTIPKMD